MKMLIKSAFPYHDKVEGKHMNQNDWYQIDNVAKVFLATCANRDTRTLRVSCTLKEDILPDLLQQALLETIEIRPQFQVRIRRGVFWHYMESTDILPQVTEEKGRVCPLLYTPGHRNNLHYRVTYFHNRINVDLFHALTDGTGAMEFLNILVLHYLRLMYPGRFDDIATHSGASADDLLENSFKHYFDNMSLRTPEGKKSYHPTGLRLPYEQLQFFELQMPIADILPKAKALSVSLTSYIGARLMEAMYMDMPSRKKKLPVTVSLPVNLRNYYPSQTFRNFFNSVNVSHVFSETDTLDDLAKEFDVSLKLNLTPEKIKAQMDHYETLENIAAIRLVPLVFKQIAVRQGSRRQAKKVSLVLSNMGVQKPPAELMHYIQNYSGFCSSTNLFVTMFSYNGTLTLGISSPYNRTHVLKDFVRNLTRDDIHVRANATEVIR
jgi:hypothetical protein